MTYIHDAYEYLERLVDDGVPTDLTTVLAAYVGDPDAYDLDAIAVDYVDEMNRRLPAATEGLLPAGWQWDGETLVVRDGPLDSWISDVERADLGEVLTRLAEEILPGLCEEYWIDLDAVDKGITTDVQQWADDRSEEPHGVEVGIEREGRTWTVTATEVDPLWLHDHRTHGWANSPYPPYHWGQCGCGLYAETITAEVTHQADLYTHGYEIAEEICKALEADLDAQRADLSAQIRRRAFRELEQTLSHLRAGEWTVEDLPETEDYTVDIDIWAPADDEGRRETVVCGWTDLDGGGGTFEVSITASGQIDPREAAAGRYAVARARLGVTGPELAALLGVQERTARAWEEGRDPIPAGVFTDVAELVEVHGRHAAGYRRRGAAVIDPSGRWPVNWQLGAARRASTELTGPDDPELVVIRA